MDDRRSCVQSQGLPRATDLFDLFDRFDQFDFFNPCVNAGR